MVSKTFKNSRIMVYFITDGTYTKIGKANDVDKRLSQLQTGNALDLKIHTLLLGDEDLESKLHKIFDFYNIKNEWFLLPDGYMNHIESEEDVEEIFYMIYEEKPQEIKIDYNSDAFKELLHLIVEDVIENSQGEVKITKKTLNKLVTEKLEKLKQTTN